MIQMGGLSTVRLEDIKPMKINCNVNIYKISKNVFCYDQLWLNIESDYIINICKILDKGTKFVPNFCENEAFFYNNLLKQIDNALVTLNTNIFFTKQKISKNINKTELQSINPSQEVSNPERSIKTKSFNSINKKPINHSNFELQEETIILREQILKSIPMYNNNEPLNNLTHNELNFLKKFCKEKPFKILRCDKNVGTMLMSNENVDKLANDFLENNESYKEIESNQTNEIVNKINTKLNELFINKNISKKVNDKLVIKPDENINCGVLKIMPKVHKKEFSIRQIISSVNHPTKKLCTAFDIMVNPFIQSITHILKDSQEMLQKLETLVSKDKLYLSSADFESLYNNIRPEHAISLMANFLHYRTNILKTYEIDLIGCLNLLELIFTCNIFKYNDRFYVQTIGIPMGCTCGPVVANLYLYILEEKWVNMNPDIIYFRYIDDTFTASKTKINQNEIQNQFLYLKLNIIEEEEVTFLDLNISHDLVTGKFKFKLYIKPTNSMCYLLTSSNHPDHIYENIIISQITRIRRICSDYIDYLYFARHFYYKLTDRGYNTKQIRGVIREIGKINRETLLPYKNKETSQLECNLKCFLEYDRTTDFLKRSIFECTKKLMNQTDKTFFEENNLFIIYTIKHNLNSMLINNLKFINNIKYSFYKCENTNCKVCAYADTAYFFKLNKFSLTFKSQSHCDSSGIVYIIACIKCNKIYIGESGRRVKDRIGEHLNNIKNFKTNLNDSIIYLNNKSEVAIHFNLKNHNIKQDLKFFIFEDSVNNSLIRKSIETDIINLCKIDDFDILNAKNKQPDCKNICYLTFQDKF